MRAAALVFACLAYVTQARRTSTSVIAQHQKSSSKHLANLLLMQARPELARLALLSRQPTHPLARQINPNMQESPRPNFETSFEIPKKGISEYGTVNMNFKPLLESSSELVVIRSPLPLNLAAAPQGRSVTVTQDGKSGEQVGDILRFTLKWNAQQPSMFDVQRCMEQNGANAFDQVVAALVTNDGSYADEIVMIFERPIESA